MQDLGAVLLEQRAASADVKFIVGSGGLTLLAHKCVLVARSPVLATELSGDFRAAQEQSISVPHVEPSCFEVFLRFIYIGKAQGLPDISCEMAVEVAVLADLYGLVDYTSSIVELLRRKCIWGTNVGLALALAFRIPATAECHGPIMDVLGSKVSSKLDLNFDSELATLGDSGDGSTLSSLKLKAKLKLLNTVLRKVTDRFPLEIHGTASGHCLHPHSGNHIRKVDCKFTAKVGTEEKAVLERVNSEIAALLATWNELPEVVPASKRPRLS